MSDWDEGFAPDAHLEMEYELRTDHELDPWERDPFDEADDAWEEDWEEELDEDDEDQSGEVQP